MASERERGQTERSNTFGVEDCIMHNESEQNLVGTRTKEGDSPVSEVQVSRQYPEYLRTRETRREAGGTTLQA